MRRNKLKLKSSPQKKKNTKHLTKLKVSFLTLASASLFSTASAEPATHTQDFNSDRNAYFGDLHLHTKYSFDAFIFNVRATPDDAYAFAKGEPIKHAAGFDMRLSGPPLDFLAVTDHAEYLGVAAAMADPSSPLSKVPYAPDMVSNDPRKILDAFGVLALSLREGKRRPELEAEQTESDAWQIQIDAAKRHNEPGVFTSLVGYEFTSAPDGRNLHRNVIFAGDNVPNRPFSALDSQNPEDLWQWLDAQRANGIEALAIPHNSNGSDGTMFEATNWAGEPIDALYAALRVRNEPLAEITQVKGTSETHPLLSPNDEWAGFEISNSYIGSTQVIKKVDGGYVRRALQLGLALQSDIGVNPYKMGFVGASDTHNAGGSYREDNYHSKVGLVDATPERRGSTPPPGKSWDNYLLSPVTNRYVQWGASGLTGVWAEENTRAAIYAALRRRETFATSGPRIKLRFFGGFKLPKDMENKPNFIKKAYRRAAPMGGDIKRKGKAAPEFILWAQRDPQAGSLQRIQIVKGWIENGEMHEKIFDVSCSDGLSPSKDTNRCGDNDASVDIQTCQTSPNKGAGELRARWRDPDFQPSLPAFYYMRVLENPSCRWSTWDAIRSGSIPNPNMPATIQERAWSSPIWYQP